ncbi:MAG: hypothetical protein ACFKPT_15225 [Gloeotrichia echinulata GP01]
MKILSKMLSSLVVISAMTLVEVIVSNPSNSQVISTNFKAAKTSERKEFSNYNSPSLVSQLVAPAYSCNISVQQPNATAPTANYYASVTCSVGQPGSIVLGIYNSNVNFPTERRYIGDNTHSCTLTASTCTTPTYARTINRTQHFWVYTGVNIVGIDGKVYTRTDISPTLRTYNDKGASYPFIKPTRGDMPIVQFPDPPYVERVPRAANFADELRKIYVAKNWTIPSDPEAHHIKPIAWGGGNDVSANGVFLGKATHQLFTTWWASFSNLNW